MALRWRTAYRLSRDRLEIRGASITGLDKFGYNAVHGYYIQISRGQSHLAPINYVRRQTLEKCRTLHYS